MPVITIDTINAGLAELYAYRALFDKMKEQKEKEESENEDSDEQTS